MHFSYTHVLQDGSQYTDLYEVSQSSTEMIRKLQGVYTCSYVHTWHVIHACRNIINRVFNSYSISGVIAVSEFYFTRFLYICFGGISVGLGTASVNVMITLNLVSGLLGGFLADRVLGEYVLLD